MLTVCPPPHVTPLASFVLPSLCRCSSVHIISNFTKAGTNKILGSFDIVDHTIIPGTVTKQASTETSRSFSTYLIPDLEGEMMILPEKCFHCTIWRFDNIKIAKCLLRGTERGSNNFHKIGNCNKSTENI